MNNKGYIFVSYAHKDIDVIRPILELLEKHFDIWYDSNIEKWSISSDNIATHIEECSLFLYLISKNSINSINCQNEIHFARERNIPFINVFIEEVDLPKGFELRFGRYQMCFIYQYDNIDKFIDDIIKKNDEEHLNINLKNNKALRSDIKKEEENNNKNKPLKENVEEYKPLGIKVEENKTKGIVDKEINIKKEIVVDNIDIDDGEEKPSNYIFDIDFEEDDDSDDEPIDIGDDLDFDDEDNDTNPFEIKDGVLVDFDETNYPLDVVKLPDEVKVIDSYALSDLTKIKEIIIPDSVISIKDYAFYYSKSIISIEIPDSIKEIEENAFDGVKNLKYNEYDNGLYLGNKNNPYVTLMNIKDEKLDYIHIHQNTLFIIDFFFEQNNLKHIYLYDNIINIGRNDFDFVKLDYNEIDVNYKITDFNKYLNIKGKDNISGRTHIYNLNEEEIIHIDLPLNLDHVPYRAFMSLVNIKSIYLHEGVKYIDDEAFAYCDNLETINIPSKVEKIGKWAFSYCTFSYFCIPDNVKFIDQHIFFGCENIEKLYLPFLGSGDKSNYQLKWLFGNIPSSLKTIRLSSNCKKIGFKAFEGLEHPIDIIYDNEDNIKEIGPYAFSNYVGDNIKIPNGVEIIDYAAFFNCKNLKEVIIPDNVKTIKEAAFSDCINLYKVTLGSNVKLIENNAFSNCTNLRIIINRSKLHLAKGKENNGGIAKNAVEIIKEK